MINKKLLAALLCGTALTLTGCVSDGNMYRSDVYQAGMVNQAQEVRTVEIIAINPAQVAVSNRESTNRGQLAGAILGAIAGAAITSHNSDRTSSRVAGGVAGAALGGLAGDAIGGGSNTRYVDGVQLVYRTANGKVFQSAQVGRLCEYRTGTAIMVSSEVGETRIQPNNPYGCGSTR